ncbi:hypothetical protein BGW80DRAFT_1465450 [Lactifluus volemus]|nr:hypothetical protein BGW80DRAFT_1465450 [Lactifluus volemus]
MRDAAFQTLVLAADLAKDTLPNSPSSSLNTMLMPLPVRPSATRCLHPLRSDIAVEAVMAAQGQVALSAPSVPALRDIARREAFSTWELDWLDSPCRAPVFKALIHPPSAQPPDVILGIAKSPHTSSQVADELRSQRLRLRRQNLHVPPLLVLVYRLPTMPLPTFLSALFSIPNCSFFRFLPRSYVLVVVGACAACLARWIAVQVRFFLPSHRLQ